MNRFPFAFAPLLVLAACATDQNMTLSPAHAPVVATTDLAVDLAAGPGGLAPGEAQRLAGFLAGVRPALGDRIATDASGAARDTIARAVGELGVLLSPEPAAPGALGTTRVVLTRASVSLPGCPDWSQGQTPQSAPAATRNFGCASQANVAAMLADPQDLVRGRGGSGAIDPMTSVKAILAWRTAKTTGEAGLKSESTRTGGR